MSSDPLEGDDDPFKPPAVPTPVACLHCGREYDSYLIEWRVETASDGGKQGFWCCPTPGCDGRGFGFDILPTDPEYQDENGGWVWDDDDDDDDDFDDGEDEDDFDLDEVEDGIPPSMNGDGTNGRPHPPDEEIPF
jgi:hypothetical protein